MIDRVPICPDCGEPGIKVKGNYYRCPECRAVWKEQGWENKVAKEVIALENSNKLIGINLLINIAEIKCDVCSETIMTADKYCYNTNELIDTGERGKRYCVKCSFKSGYLRMARNTGTGKVYPVIFLYKDEVPHEVTETAHVKEMEDYIFGRFCEQCGQQLVKLKWSEQPSEDIFIPICNNGTCSLYHTPQGSRIVEQVGER